MSRLLLSSFCLFFLVFSCKGTQDSNGDNIETESQEITAKDIEQIDFIEFLLDVKTEEYTIDWAEYNQLQELVDNLKTGDLSLFFDNREANNTMLTEFEQNIPEPLNSASITARISAFKTQFLKLESLSNLTTTSKQELLVSIKDFFVAFSNLNLQLNKKVEFDSQDIIKP